MTARARPETRGCANLVHLTPAGASLMLAVGTKPHQKGFDRLLAAFARLAPRHPSWHLVILGLDPASGSHRRAVADLVAQWQADPLLRQRVHLPGPVGNVADWYGACDLFVLSSRYEGFPNVLLEAMVSGCACLACACPTGPEEIVRHGQDGWLVPAEADAALLERELERLIDDPLLRRRLGSEARAVRQRYGEATGRQQCPAALQPLMPCAAPPPCPRQLHPSRHRNNKRPSAHRPAAATIPLSRKFF